MNILKSFKNDIFAISNSNFNGRALELFYFQAQHNVVYKKYIKSLNKNPNKISTVEEIPFLPIEFFKYHEIKTSSWTPEQVFESSGTSNQVPSRHYIEDLEFYNSISLNIFTSFYGHPDGFHILALLPSYLERKNASLVAMVDYFISNSKSVLSGFYLNNLKDLAHNIVQYKSGERKILLIGVTFALLDFAQEHEMDLHEIILMETGGMKGRKEELIRKQVHDILKKKFNLKQVHSEYGMTELLSQAYAKEEGKFRTPPWMKILIRDLNDPFTYLPANRNGGINIIDLANIHSCAFIETRDIGFTHSDESFEVLGRFDNSDIRGCSLMTVNSDQ